MDITRYDDMRKLLILRTIAESGSIQKAASVLKVTPSAVSQSLRALEIKMSQALFTREQGRLESTAYCREFLERARPAFSALDTLFADQAKKPRMNTLDLGTYESLALEILPKFTERLKTDHPGIHLNFCISRTAELLKALRSGKLCTALIAETDQLDGVNVVEVATEELGVFVSACEREKHETPGYTQKLGFGSLATGSDGVLPYFRRFLAQFGAKPNLLIQSDSFEVIAEAAKKGLVAGILPRRVARRHGAELVELEAIDEKRIEDHGRHRILLASEDLCDPEEARYLAGVVSECLASE